MNCLFGSVTVMFLWWCRWTRVHTFLWSHCNRAPVTMATPQFAILTDCQSLGRDYYDIILQHRPQIAAILELDMKSHHSPLIWNLEKRASGFCLTKQPSRYRSRLPNLRRGESGGFLKGSHYQRCSEVQFRSPLTFPVTMHLEFQCNMLPRRNASTDMSVLFLSSDDCTHMLKWLDSGSQYADGQGKVSHFHLKYKMTG